MRAVALASASGGAVLALRPVRWDDNRAMDFADEMTGSHGKSLLVLTLLIFADYMSIYIP